MDLVVNGMSVFHTCRHSTTMSPFKSGVCTTVSVKEVAERLIKQLEYVVAVLILSV